MNTNSKSRLSGATSPSPPPRTLLVAGAAAPALALIIVPVAAQARNEGRFDRGLPGRDDRWVGTSGTAPPGPAEPPFGEATEFEDQTLRQILHTRIGGKRVQVRFSNEFGTEPLSIGAARFTLRGLDSGNLASISRELTFGGESSITIPAGAPALSVPIVLNVPPLSDLAISMYLPEPTLSIAPESETAAADQRIAGYRQRIARAHEKDILICGATITPFGVTMIEGDYTPEREERRQAINEWIRTSGEFDAVIDFDAAIRDPQLPTRMLPAYDSGDHLHPDDEGIRTMGESIPLGLFARNRDRAPRHGHG